MKSPRNAVLLLVALTLTVMLSGCGKNSSPTAPTPLDQSPPAMPSQISAETDATSGSAVLEWAPSASANAASYEIYQYLPCPESESAYVLVGTTEAGTTTYGLPSANHQTTLYYRLRTVSSTGVKSSWSAPVLVTIGPAAGGGTDPEGIMEH